jgi:hypothetical protein
MNTKIPKEQHDRRAPYWAVTLVILAVIGLSSGSIDLGAFWKSYGLDMTGPAWNYILFRGLFTGKVDNAWTRFFNPLRTFSIFILVCLIIEAAQYFKLYDATYDPWDFLAYGSLLVPVFLIDFFQTRRDNEKK